MHDVANKILSQEAESETSILHVISVACITLQAQSLSELSMECSNANILTLAEEQLSFEGMLSIENPNHVTEKKSVVYQSHFTKKRKLILLAKRY